MFARETTTGDAAVAVLRRQLALASDGLTELERSHDVELLHDVRVAMRRFRAGLAAFADALPPEAKKLRKRLGSLSSTLGSLRDLDIQIERVAAHRAREATPESIDTIISVLERRRRNARERLLRSLATDKTSRLLADARELIGHGPGSTDVAAEAVETSAPAILDRAHRRVTTLGDALVAVPDDAAEQALHALRIRAKRLRYTVEFLAPLYGETGKAYVKRVTALQDVLGALRDASVTASSMREMAATLDPMSAFEAGRIAQSCLDDVARHRRSFPGTYRPISGKRWEKLRRAASEPKLHVVHGERS